MDPPPVQYVTTRDGFSIAYAVSGTGPPFVEMSPAFSHLQLFWRDDHTGPWLEGLAARFRLVRFDSRGKGMSNRGLPADFTAADCCLDLDAVIDRLQLDDFVLMASTPIQCQVAVGYALEHPERVRALVLASPLDEGSTTLLRALVGSFAAEDWYSFLQTMAGLVRAGDLEERVQVYKQAMTQADWVAYAREAEKVDIRRSLPQVGTPTLVLHPRDFVSRVATSARVAAAIPNAQLALVEGTGSVGDAEPGLRAIDSFLAGIPLRPATNLRGRPARDVLSLREVDVLRLIARGRSNPQIAEELFISVNTVQNHVSSILAKAGLTNRAEASSYAQRWGLGPNS